MVDTTTKRMTASEYLQLPESVQPTSLIDGELIVSPSPVPKHQQVSMKFIRLLLNIIDDGELFSAPMDVHFDDANITQPDILWIKPGGKCTVGEKFLAGAPDFIIEILSPGSVSDDKIRKFKLYERFGVAEYWIVDPTEAYVEVFILVEGKYQLQDIYPPDATFESVLLGKMIDLKQIFSV